MQEETRVYTEEDWNEFAVKQVRELGKAATGWWKYDASKVLAEQGTNPQPDRVQSNTSNLHVRSCMEVLRGQQGDNLLRAKYYRARVDPRSTSRSMVTRALLRATLTDSTNVQPIPDDPSSPADFNTPSPILEWKQLFEVPPPEKPTPTIFNYVDIRDVTEMHVRALELPEAAGQRFTAVSRTSALKGLIAIIEVLTHSVSVDVCSWQDWCKLLSYLFSFVFLTSNLYTVTQSTQRRSRTSFHPWGRSTR